MQTEIIELVENHLASEFGVGLVPKDLGALDDISAEQLEFLSSQVHDWDRRLHDDLLRPKPQDSQPFSAMHTHPYNGLLQTDVDHIKRQLLFFHSVAIVRPEVQALWGATPAQRRESVKRFVSALIELKPLIERGIVHLTPTFGFYSNEIEGGAGMIRHACTEEQRIQQWLESNAALVDDYSKSARPGDPYFDAGVKIMSATAYGHKLAATHPLVAGLYAELMKGELISGAPVSPSTTAFASNLNQFALPGLSKLSWDNILDIRDNEDSFRRWREELNILVATVDPEIPQHDFVRKFNALAAASMGAAASRIEDQVKKSSALSKARTGIAEFGIGFVASASVYATFGISPDANLWEEMLKITQTAGLTALLPLVVARSTRQRPDLLRSHYAVFRYE